MFYQESREIVTYKTNPNVVEKIDSFLGNLTREKLDKITVSYVYSIIGTSYELVKYILDEYTKKKILKKQYEIHCPECGNPLERYNLDQIYEKLPMRYQCYCCNEEVKLTLKDVFISYQRIKSPTASKKEIEKTIREETHELECNSENDFFSNADSVVNNKDELYKMFYNPDESAYEEFNRLKNKLSFDYGKNTTSKGTALEKLVLEIFGHIRYTKVTNEVHTGTNQFDCTALCGISTVYPSIFNLLTPYFIIECKNEPDKKPNNTYCNKLLSIMDTNEAKIGIIWGRKEATSTCFTIAREHYLKHSGSGKDQIIITCSDNDLEKIIDDRVNILQYLDYKIFMITSNSSTCTYKMFLEK